MDLAKDNGISEIYAIPLLIAFMHSISIIIVAITLYLWNGAKDKVEANVHVKNQLNKSQAELESFQKKVRSVIPMLPSSQIKILKGLSESDIQLGSGDSGACDLEREGFIKRLHRINDKLHIFGIVPVVATELAFHLARQRKGKLDNFVLNITDEERNFLQLFYSENVMEGTEQSEKMMSANVFRAGTFMHPEIIENFIECSKDSTTEAFRLPKDTAELLKKAGFSKQCIRDEAYLDANWIEPWMPTGGGAPGSRGR